MGDGYDEDPTTVKHAVREYLTLLIRERHPDPESGMLDAVDQITANLGAVDERLDQFVAEAILGMRAAG